MLLVNQSAFKTVADQIYNANSTELPTAVFEAYNTDLHAAVQGLDEERAKLLKNNLSRFSAAKTNNLVQQLDRARADADGVVRSKKEYDLQAKKITNTFNRYQVAEYNTAVHRTRVVKQWAQFERERHLYPNIEWLRTRSASPREVHLKYVGRIWSMDDPFWKMNHPGCTYQCKCGWKTTDAAPTDNAEVKQVSASPGLEGNSYFTDEIFGDKHPYFSNVKKHIPSLGVLHNADDIAYLNRADGEIKYQVHYNAQKEFEEVNKPFLPAIRAAGYKDIRFLPTIERHETELRKRYFGKYADSKKCADVSADGLWIELKNVKNSGPKTRRNIIDVIGDVAKKADVAIIKIERVFEDDMLRQLAATQFDKHTNLQRIIFIDEVKSIDCVRP